MTVPLVQLRQAIVVYVHSDHLFPLADDACNLRLVASRTTYH